MWLPSARAALLLLLASWVGFVSAWSKEDHEIFRLKDEVQLHEGGPNATFYTFLNVPPNASRDDITKAYRKLSRALHPDKARSNWLANYDKPPAPQKAKEGSKPTVHVHRPKKPSSSEIARFNKAASARFERLSLVANILRGPLRERYDHFLTHGFPAWRGTGYYYTRFRPGLGTVLMGLFVFVGGGAHYVALWLGWKRRREFVERYVRHARRMAWGDEGAIGAIPGLGGPMGNGEGSRGVTEETEESVSWNRRQKRAMEKEKRKEGKSAGAASVKSARAANKARTDGISAPQEAELISGPIGAKKRTVAENGKILIVDSVGNVFLEEETEEGDVQEFLLDVSGPHSYNTPNIVISRVQELISDTDSPTKFPHPPLWTRSWCAGPNLLTA